MKIDNFHDKLTLIIKKELMTTPLDQYDSLVEKLFSKLKTLLRDEEKDYIKSLQSNNHPWMTADFQIKEFLDTLFKE